MEPHFSHLVARGIHAAHRMTTKPMPNGNEGEPSVPQVEVSPWGMLLLVLTAAVFFVVSSLIEYSLKYVVGTLAMVETPSATVVAPSKPSTDSSAKGETEDGNNDDNDSSSTVCDAEKQGLLAQEEPTEIVLATPVTTKIRSTIKHITAQAGRGARFRGILPGTIFGLTAAAATHVLHVHLPHGMPAKGAVVSLLVGVALSNLHMAWTHSIIAAPSSTKVNYCQRLGGLRAFRSLAVPSAIRAAAVFAITRWIYLFAASVISLCSTIAARQHGCHKKVYSMSVLVYALGGFAIAAFSATVVLLLLVPTVIAHNRVEASLLPENEESLVPMDRSFGRTVTPVFAGGSGGISFLEAWRSIDGETHRRVVRMFAKIVLVMLALVCAGVQLMLLETWLVFGAQFPQALGQLRQQLHPVMMAHHHHHHFHPHLIPPPPPPPHAI